MGCFVSWGPGLFAGTLSSSLDWDQAFAGKGGKMGVGSTRPLRKESWVDVESGGIVDEISLEFGSSSHFCKGPFTWFT